MYVCNIKNCNIGRLKDFISSCKKIVVSLEIEIEYNAWHVLFWSIKGSPKVNVRLHR